MKALAETLATNTAQIAEVASLAGTSLAKSPNPLSNANLLNLQTIPANFTAGDYLSSVDPSLSALALPANTINSSLIITNAQLSETTGLVAAIASGEVVGSAEQLKKSEQSKDLA